MNKEINLKLTFSVEQLADEISKRLANALKVQVKEVPKRMAKLTRKKAYQEIGISGPTLDKFVEKGFIHKEGIGKATRFMEDDVEYAKQNLKKFLYQ